MARKMKDSGVEWIGEIPEDWRAIKCKYLLERIYSGGTPTSSNEENYSDEGIPFVSIGDMSKNDYVYETKRSLTKRGIDEKKLEVLKKGTILYSIYATIGAVSELGVDATINQAILALISDDQVVDKRYFKYGLVSLKSFAEYLANGNTQNNLNSEIVRSFYVPLPFMETQKMIASFLDRKNAAIDSIIEKTRVSIEEYKKLRQAVITQAVTKGVRGDRAMKNTGVEWIGACPEDWAVHRIANLYDERSENGEVDLPILQVSINTGISDHEIADEDLDRVFVRSEDRTKYKRVYPGDLAYNMMRAWQGAFGAVRVDGMISPAYVVAKPKDGVQIDSRYMEALLRTPEAIEEMHRYSRGIADFRLRLYWPEFKNIRVCFPSYEEQVEIADYIDEKTSAIDRLIQKKEQYMVELETMKKSLIYEYVTGKKEV